MIVLGGGPVGSELAQAWSTLGTEVTLVEGERAAPAPRGALRRRAGGRRRCASSTASTSAPASLAERVGAGDDGGVVVELDGGERIEAAELLVAVGRKPRTAGIGLESVGVEPGEGGFLETDDRLRVGGRDWLYAVGDVNGRALFTHMGKYQAWVVGENAKGHEVEAIAEGLGSPRVTFTDPQVAAVGKTLEQAEEAGIDARAVDVPTDGTAGASFYGKDTGGTAQDRRRRGHAARSSAPPSPASRPPTSCTRRRSRSSARSRSTACATPSPPTPPAARSGSSSSRRTGCSTRAELCDSVSTIRRG